MGRGTNKTPKSSVQQVGKPCAHLSQSKATARDNPRSGEKLKPRWELASQTPPPPPLLAPSEWWAPGTPPFPWHSAFAPPAPTPYRNSLAAACPPPESPLPRPAPPGGGRRGLPGQPGAVPPTTPRGPHWQPNGPGGRRPALRLAHAARPSRTRPGDYVVSPGRVPNSAPPAAPSRPAGPAAPHGRPCTPARRPPGSPSAPEAGRGGTRGGG